MWAMGEKNAQAGSDNENVTFLGKSADFKGIVRFNGTIRVDGHLEGEVHTTGTLIVEHGWNPSLYAVFWPTTVRMRPVLASVTTTTSNSSSSKSRAVCIMQTWLSQPATTMVLRWAAGWAGFCRCLGKLRALPETLATGRTTSPRPSATAENCILGSTRPRAASMWLSNSGSVPPKPPGFS